MAWGFPGIAPELHSTVKRHSAHSDLLLQTGSLSLPCCNSLIENCPHSVFVQLHAVHCSKVIIPPRSSYQAPPLFPTATATAQRSTSFQTWLATFGLRHWKGLPPSQPRSPRVSLKSPTWIVCVGPVLVMAKVKAPMVQRRSSRNPLDGFLW